MIRTFALCDGCGYPSDSETYPEQWPQYIPSVDSPPLRFCSQSCLTLHLGAAEQPSRHIRLGFNDQEIDMLRLVALGKSNCEIAQTLSLAESTVKNRLSVVFAKLKTSDRIQAILAAHALCLINLNTTAEEFQRGRGPRRDPLFVYLSHQDAASAQLQ